MIILISRDLKGLEGVGVVRKSLDRSRDVERDKIYSDIEVIRRTISKLSFHEVPKNRRL